mgnify:CR=1 FL=1
MPLAEQGIYFSYTGMLFRRVRLRKHFLIGFALGFLCTLALGYMQRVIGEKKVHENKCEEGAEQKAP